MLPPSINQVREFEYLIDENFLVIHNYYTDIARLSWRMILTLRNRRLQIINNVVGRRIPGDSLTLFSADSVTNADKKFAISDIIPQFAFFRFSSSSCYHFKESLSFFLLRNINPPEGDYNGTRYVVHNMTSRLFRFAVAAGKDKGTNFLYPKIPSQPEIDDLPVAGFSTLKFPICIFLCVTTKQRGSHLEGKLSFISVMNSLHMESVGLLRAADPRNVIPLNPKTKKAKNISINVPQITSIHNVNYQWFLWNNELHCFTTCTIGI